jgi:hypothetical protein
MLAGQTGDDVAEREGGTIDQLAFAEAEFNNFILHTHRELLRLEGRQDSSLSLICRIDVSLIRDADGSLHYFVNEVERGLTICLFSAIGNGSRVRQVMDEWGPLMVGWIKRQVEARAKERPIKYKTTKNM